MTDSFPTAPNLEIIECDCAVQSNRSERKSHSMTHAGNTLKKVAMFIKRNAPIAAIYLINVFSVTVSRKIGKDEILY